MVRPLACLALLVLVAGCATSTPGTAVAPLADTPTVSSAPAPSSTVPTTSSAGPTTTATAAPPPPAPAPPAQFGNPAGKVAVPAEGKAEDTSKPTKVIGDGTPNGCTSPAVVAAVAAGGVITFNCGPAPVTITMTETARVKAGPKIVLDGGGRVTLSGGGKRQIVVMDVPNQAGPQLVLQNISFTDGNSATDDGGGAVYVRGGKVKVVNARFAKNRCAQNGPDLGGAGLRVNQARSAPVYVVSSTFEDGTCANGGAMSGLHVTFVVLNSILRRNNAVGRGANPARAGTPGGGSGGAIYTDGDDFTVRIAGSIVEDNHANEGGGAVFFVSNNRVGSMTIDGSTLRRNRSDGFETIKGIFYLGSAPKPAVSGSTIS
jgi:hypothetical protein